MPASMSFLFALLVIAGLTQVQASYNASSLATSQILQDPFPYDFPNENAAPVALFPMPSCHGFTLEEATIDHLQHAMSNGKLTSVNILNCYLARVTQTNGYIKYVHTVRALTDCLTENEVVYCNSILMQLRSLQL